MKTRPEPGAVRAMNAVFGGDPETGLHTMSWPEDPGLGGGELSYDGEELRAREVGQALANATPAIGAVAVYGHTGADGHNREQARRAMQWSMDIRQ